MSALASAQALKPHPTARAFKGAEGEGVTMVFLEPRAKNELLIKFHGIGGEWDNSVFLHKRIVFADDRENYELLNVRGNPNHVSIVRRSGTHEVYAPGARRMPIRMAYSEADSKLVKVDLIVAEYAKAQRQPR